MKINAIKLTAVAFLVAALSANAAVLATENQSR